MVGACEREALLLLLIAADSLAEPDRCNRPHAEGALINGLVCLAQRTHVKLRESGKTNQIALFVIIT